MAADVGPFSQDAVFKACPFYGAPIVIEDSKRSISHRVPECNPFAALVAEYRPEVNELRFVKDARLQRKVPRL
jgi:hypothetical protein